MTASGLCGWERVRGDGMVNQGGKSGCKVVRGDMSVKEGGRHVVGWDMGGRNVEGML